MNNRPYTLIRSARKTLSLEVSRTLEVIVRAPSRMPKRDIDAVVAQYDAWIDAHIEKRRLHSEAHPEPTAQEIHALRMRAKETMPSRVEYYARLMGLAPTGLKITSARTRYGSCSSKNSLCFSLYLMRYPQAAIDYVVVHELAHIVHKNHGPDFYRLVESVLPDWKKRRALLKG